MRLIDADELKIDFGFTWDDIKPTREEMFENIDRQPTVEPKTGHWIKISPAGIYECSQCGQNVMTGDIEVYAYCHHCGAYMKEDTDATN